MRARRLTREMCNYWRRRDREMADGKRKREKLDKEAKKILIMRMYFILKFFESMYFTNI